MVHFMWSLLLVACHGSRFTGESLANDNASTNGTDGRYEQWNSACEAQLLSLKHKLKTSCGQFYVCQEQVTDLVDHGGAVPAKWLRDLVQRRDGKTNIDSAIAWSGLDDDDHNLLFHFLSLRHHGATMLEFTTMVSKFVKSDEVQSLKDCPWDKAKNMWQGISHAWVGHGANFIYLLIKKEGITGDRPLIRSIMWTIEVPALAHQLQQFPAWKPRISFIDLTTNASIDHAPTPVTQLLVAYLEQLSGRKAAVVPTLNAIGGFWAIFLQRKSVEDWINCPVPDDACDDE